MVANLRRAESFFFEQVAALRRGIHGVVASRDTAAARQLKVVFCAIIFAFAFFCGAAFCRVLSRRRICSLQSEQLVFQLKVKSIEAFAVLNMNGFDKVRSFPLLYHTSPPPPLPPCFR
jgi:hypothetical protein